MNSSWKLSIILIVALAVLAIFLNLPAGQQFIKSATNLPRVVTKNLQPEKPKPVRIVFVGDIMFDRGVETSVQNNFGGDYSQLFTAASWIGDADITFANLEGPVSDLGNDVGSKYSFRMNPVILPVLKNLGIDVVSFANNHVGDWNIIGFTDTLKRLQDTGIVAIGAGQNKTDASRVKIIEKNGMKIGFLGFSDVGPDWIKATEKNAGILIASDPNRLQIIHDAKSQVDFLVVSYHWGTEYQPFTERQKDLAESSIDAGADLVIGHHPHVIQDYEEYKNKLIFYSLGNFMFDQNFSADVMHGLVVDITINPDGTYKNVDLSVSQQNSRYQIIETRPFEREHDAVLAIKSKPITCPSPKDPNQTDMKLFPVSTDAGLGKYSPAHLQPIPKTIPVRGASMQCLTDETIGQLGKMVAAAKAEKLSLVVSSAYRSSDIQTTLFTNNQAAHPDQDFPSVAQPEHSEHQLGTTIDFRSGTSVDFTLEAFGKSPEYTWLEQHAREYGFVRSYPDGQEQVTGYHAEPWHWRYVGVDIANAIHDSGLTPYEYLKKEYEKQ